MDAIEALNTDLTGVGSDPDGMSPLTSGDVSHDDGSCDAVTSLTEATAMSSTDVDQELLSEESQSVSVGETTPSGSASIIHDANSALSTTIPVTSEQVIGLLLQANEADGSSGDSSHPQHISVAVSLPEGAMVNSDTSISTVQAITLADGTTAFIQHPKDGKFLEGQTVTLEDGSTAIVQGIAEKVGSGEPSSSKVVDGQPIQLEDGTTAYLQATSKSAMAEGLQAITLEDGTTAYIAHPINEALFGDAATLDSSSLSLEQLASQTVLCGGTNRLAAEKALAIGEKAYRCGYDGCGRLYTTLHHLKVHERSHTGDRPFKCEFPGCGKAFATGYGLKSHTRVHTGEKPYKCPEDSCDKAFKTSGDLQKHVRTHTGERPFKCPFEGCTRSFTTSNIRKVHIRTHTGERPYVCQHEGCGRAFASATNYKNHVRIHTGEKPYVCTVQGCGKRFTEYSSLYKHHVVHTHSKPYVCNHCGKTYRQTSTLAMHKRTAHGEDVTPESEAQLFSQQQQEQLPEAEPPGKRARLQFTLANADGSSGQEEGEGTLVINTADAQQVAMVTSDGVSVVTEDQTMGMVTLQGSTQVALQQLQQHQGITSITVGDQGQQVLVVTDPGQLEALQQLAQQQQHFETPDTIDAPPTTDDTSSQAIVAPTGDTTDSAMIMFQAE